MLKLFEQEYDCKIKHGFELDFVTLIYCIKFLLLSEICYMKK